MRFGWLVPLVVLGVGAGGAVALFKTRPVAEPLETREKVWPVAVTQATPATQRPELTLFGRVESPRSTRLTAALTADVVQVHVREGDQVQHDALVITLDDRESSLLLRQREAERAEIAAQIRVEEQRNANDRDALARELKVLELARRAVRRAEELASTNVGSRSQLDQAQQEEEQRSMAVDLRRTALEGHASRMAQLRARLAKAQALEDRAQLDVSRTRVRAPFDAAVYVVDVSPGDRVQPGTRLVGMYDVDTLWMRVQIPATYLPRVRAAMAADRAIEGLADVDTRTVRARLARLGTQVTPGSGGVDGLFDVTEGGPWLQIGRTVELTLRLPAVDDAIALPSQALYGNQHVYRVQDGRMQRVTVERVGEFTTSDGRQILVRSPELGPGDEIITTQLPNAVDGLRVSVARTS